MDEEFVFTGRKLHNLLDPKAQAVNGEPGTKHTHADTRTNTQTQLTTLPPAVSDNFKSK